MSSFIYTIVTGILATIIYELLKIILFGEKYIFKTLEKDTFKDECRKKV